MSMKLTTMAGALALWAGAVCAQAAGQSGAEPALAPRQNTSAAAQRASQRTTIEQARRHNAEQRKQAEVKCYQLFAVEDCLRDARNQWREVESRLRAQEVQINDAERKEKAQERLRQIEEKQSSAAAVPAGSTAQPASAVVRNPQPGSKPTVRQTNPDAANARDREAAERASQQRERQSSQASEQTAREKETAERAAKARQRQADAQKALEARRARHDREKAEATASGRQPAAPLPVPSGVAPER